MARLEKSSSPVALSRFRVVYVAVKHDRSYRAHPGGVMELTDDRITFRKEEGVTVEAVDQQAAMAAVRETLPADCEFTAQASRL